MRFGELLEAVGLECPANIHSRTVSAIVTDSRRVVKDCIFVCLSGSACDGHDYAEEAIRAGATVIVAEKVRGECVGGAAIILVDNTRHTASLLYNVWFSNPSEALKIIGVTGTNGKTSVASMLLEIFEANGHVCGFLGTVGYTSANRRKIFTDVGMTTPPPEILYSALAQMRDDGVEYVFMEVSSHALSQCRTDAISFEVAIFTNLTEDHLDFHKNMESYYKAKEKIFTQCRRAVINADDGSAGRLVRFFKENGIFFKTCSQKNGDFCALFKENAENGVKYLLKASEETHRAFLPLHGEFQIMNSLEAIATASLCGIEPESAISALAKINPIKGRMERFKGHEKQKIDIFIDYAHTPDALEKLLYSVRELREKKSRIVLVFGCGGEREREKRRAMGQIASRLADLTIITSDNSRREPTEEIIKQILKGIDKERPYAVIKDRREAIRLAIRQYCNDGDILVLAGKGHETYQIDGEGVHPFDEREIVRETFEELYS